MCVLSAISDDLATSWQPETGSKVYFTPKIQLAERIFGLDATKSGSTDIRTEMYGVNVAYAQ